MWLMRTFSWTRWKLLKTDCTIDGDDRSRNPRDLKSTTLCVDARVQFQACPRPSFLHWRPHCQWWWWTSWDPKCLGQCCHQSKGSWLAPIRCSIQRSRWDLASCLGSNIPPFPSLPILWKILPLVLRWVALQKERKKIFKEYSQITRIFLPKKVAFQRKMKACERRKWRYQRDLSSLHL